MNAFQCNAATNGSEEHDKDKVYKRLKSVNEREVMMITILMGDLDTKIGRDINGYKEVLGLCGNGEMSKNRRETYRSVWSQQVGRARTCVSVSLEKESQGDMDMAKRLDTESGSCTGKKLRRLLLDMRVSESKSRCMQSIVVLHFLT